MLLRARPFFNSWQPSVTSRLNLRDVRNYLDDIPCREILYKVHHSVEEEEKAANDPKIDPVLEDTGEDKCALVEAMLADTQYVTKSA